MKAIDTNIVLRVITADDTEQTAQAERALRAGAFVTSGVLIETEWVLRSHYKMSRHAIADALAGLLMIEGIEHGDRDGVWWAIDRYRSGADWADMIHLIDAAGLQAFITFDRDLETQAGSDAPVAVELLR